MNSHIYVVNEIGEGIEELKSKLSGFDIHLFSFLEFKVDDTKEVIKEAYIASDRPKAIILAAHTFNITSQNALLKLLEEPPRNIYFFIVTTSKSALLPTVRSRLPIVKKRVNVELPAFKIDIRRMELKDIFSYAKESREFTKEEGLRQVEALFEAVLKSGLMLKEGDIMAFDRACRAIYLNERMENVFIYLLLKIVWRRKIATKTFK